MGVPGLPPSESAVVRSFWHNQIAVRPIIIAGLILSGVACSDVPLPAQIEKFCVSETGLSKYWLDLNTAEKQGEIRYQYMGQDVRYIVRAMRLDGGKISGRADFHDSSTGENRGNPIIFDYESSTDTLKDGNTTAACQNTEGAAQS